MRKQYVYILALFAALFGYGAYSLVFGNSEAAPARGHFVQVTPSSPIQSVKTHLQKSEGYVPEETVTLSKSNSINFRNVVMPDTVARAQLEMLEKDKKLPKGVPLFLVLDTPGGDVTAGNALGDTAKSLGRPVHTITNFAASMGFNLVQRLDKRYITRSGTLMAHRVRAEGLGGQIPGELITAVNLIYREALKIEMANAARLGISHEAYTALTANEYWAVGEDAVVQNAADAIVNLRCDDSLSGTETEEVPTFFGPASVTYANCPAISAPLSIKFQENDVSAEARRYQSNYTLFRQIRGLR